MRIAIFLAAAGAAPGAGANSAGETLAGADRGVGVEGREERQHHRLRVVVDGDDRDRRGRCSRPVGRSVPRRRQGGGQRAAEMRAATGAVGPATAATDRRRRVIIAWLRRWLASAHVTAFSSTYVTTLTVPASR